LETISMGDFFDRADAIRERWDVRRHPCVQERASAVV
jgi:hypothetical protein